MSKGLFPAIVGLILLVTNAANGRLYMYGERELFRQNLRSACSFGSQLTITYDNDIICDGTISADLVGYQPTVWFRGAIKEKTYTLLMITGDHDESNGDLLHPFVEWAVTGIRGMYIQQGRAILSSIIEYLAPKYAQIKDKMKYKFILIEELRPVPFAIFSGEGVRHRFNLWDVMHSYGLNKIVAMSGLNVVL